MQINTKQLSSLLTKKIILVGENHGVCENALFVSSLIENFIALGEKISFVGFEYPKFKKQEFLNFLDKHDFDGLKNSEWGKILIEDGRFSKAHFDLLVSLLEKNIDLVFFDDAQGEWDNRDKEMAENLNNEMINSDEGRVIIIAGNIHANVNKMVVNGKDYLPMGSFLDKQHLQQVELKYDSGEFYNFGRKKFIPQINPGAGIEKVNEELIYFHIPVATPTK